MRGAINLPEWLDSPRGQMVLRWEREVLSSLWTRFYGYTALVIGSWGAHLPELPERWRVETVGHDPQLHGAALTDLRHLPLMDGSADLVVLRHSLAFAPSPHQLLREADRILSKRGQLLVLGMSPWSLWGLESTLPVQRLQWPDGLKPLGQARLTDWLHLLNFRIEDVGYYGPELPLWAHRLQLDRILQPGFFIQARKQRTPVRPMWAEARAPRPMLEPAAVPSARVLRFPRRES